MGILLSKLLSGDMTAAIINEKEFDFFARATTKVNGKRCIFLNDKKYIKDIDNTVSMIITGELIAKELEPINYGICITDEPRGLFFELMSCYESGEGFERYETTIGENCQISKTAIISPYNVQIGNNVKIGDYVVIHPNTEIGNNVTIQTGARIAEQDFNVYSYKNQTKQVYHSGKVFIGNNVLISSGVMIGQALYSYGITNIGENSFVGSNSVIGHNCNIESNCEICGNSIIGGYCMIGANSRLFMGVRISNSIIIEKNATVNIGSVVIRNIKQSETVFGNPARKVLAPK